MYAPLCWPPSVAWVSSVAKPDVTALAIELLSDRALALPGWETTAKPPELIASITEPAEIAAELSRQGVDVLMAGLCEDGDLVRVTAHDGHLGSVIREPNKCFRLSASADGPKIILIGMASMKTRATRFFSAWTDWVSLKFRRAALSS